MVKTVTIPQELLPELENWGKLTAKLFGQLRREARVGSQKDNFTPLIPELKRRSNVPHDQAWFWSEDWQKGERAVNRALAKGNYKIFDTAKELVADLHRSV